MLMTKQPQICRYTIRLSDALHGHLISYYTWFRMNYIHFTLNNNFLIKKGEISDI